jgi:hypothetical protein
MSIVLIAPRLSERVGFVLTGEAKIDVCGQQSWADESLPAKHPTATTVAHSSLHRGHGTCIILFVDTYSESMPEHFLVPMYRFLAEGYPLTEILSIIRRVGAYKGPPRADEAC